MIVIVSTAENDANPSTVWARVSLPLRYRALHWSFSIVQGRMFDDEAYINIKGESRRHSGKKSRRKNKNTKPDPELILKQNILHTPSENFITGIF